jgi:hypothetical protein
LTPSRTVGLYTSRSALNKLPTSLRDLLDLRLAGGDVAVWRGEGVSRRRPKRASRAGEGGRIIATICLVLTLGNGRGWHDNRLGGEPLASSDLWLC